MPTPAPGTATVLQANALAVPLADESVDLVVTSPPYWGLRTYTDDGQTMAEQIGVESTPSEFLEALWAVVGELWRVLKPSGSVFVNLGDKFEAKSLLLLPQRFAVGCADRGWTVRQEIIWEKPNGLPESVRDRCARKHETVWHFTRSGRHFSDMDALREPPVAPGRSPGRNAMAGQGDGPAGGPSGWRTRNAVDQPGPTGRRHASGNPLGKLPPDVWSIATEPLSVPAELGVQHYAAFPSELVRRIVLGWCPVGGVVLDPFGGSGTTAAVARALDRHGVSVDLSADYCRLAQWRCADPDLEWKVRQRTWPAAAGRPAVQCAGQLSLLDGSAA